MKTVRHISLFNEFVFAGQFVSTQTTIANRRNINCISLTKSMSYEIKNLSIDIGLNTLTANTEDYLVSYPAFPIRFFLSENPIQDCISNSYFNQSITFNGVSNPTEISLIQNDILDSSNQSSRIPPFSYANYLEIYEELGNDTYYNYSNLKTNTISEFNFFNLFYSSMSRTIGGTTDFKSNMGFNDINSFSFNSNNFSNLSIAIFPRMRFISLGTFNLNLNYTINFDLIQESP